MSDKLSDLQNPSRSAAERTEYFTPSDRWSCGPTGTKGLIDIHIINQQSLILVLKSSLLTGRMPVLYSLPLRTHLMANPAIGWEDKLHSDIVPISLSPRFLQAYRKNQSVDFT
jgi:hypothetical protein